MNEEMAAKLTKAKSPEEIIVIASEYEKEISPEKARELFDTIQNQLDQELSLDDLDGVAGGNIFDKLEEFFGGFF